jgi:hypothetical protein
MLVLNKSFCSIQRHDRDGNQRVSTAADGGPTYSNIVYEVVTSGFTIDRKVHHFRVELSGKLRFLPSKF